MFTQLYDEVHHAPETVTISKAEHERLQKCEREANFLNECLERMKFDIPTTELAGTVGHVASNKFKDRLVDFGLMKKVGSKSYLPDKWAVEKKLCYCLGGLGSQTYWTLKGRLEVAKLFRFEMSQYFKDLKI